MNHIVDAVMREGVVSVLRGAAEAYGRWWLKQWHEAPVHTIIESFLVLFVLWIIFAKRMYDPEKRGRRGARPTNELTRAEEEALLAEWEPEPLVPEVPDDKRHVPDVVEPVVVVRSVDGGAKVVIREEEGAGVGGGGAGGGEAGVEEREVWQMTSGDFLGFGGGAEVREEARRVLEEYTCGSCGPRGFYGTTRKHLELEDAIAEFMGVSEAISYSDASSAISSAIPAFSKRGDLLFVDKGVNHAVRTGVWLSRSQVVWFEHNDLEDLERCLRRVREQDEAGEDHSQSQRRFIVTEGLFSGSGQVCNLPLLLRLRERYKVRILMDDSLGFGTLGKRGRGTAEFWDKEPKAVDVTVVSMGNVLGSVGGFCIGSREAVDHQRLSGAGYCFSASMPPFLCAVASKSLSLLAAHPARIAQLRKRIDMAIATARRRPEVDVLSSELSPVVLVVPHVAAAARKQEEAEVDEEARLAEKKLRHRKKSHPRELGSFLVFRTRTREDAVLEDIATRVRRSDPGFLVARTRFLTTEPRPRGKNAPLRLYLSVNHPEAAVAAAINAIADAARDIAAREDIPVQDAFKPDGRVLDQPRKRRVSEID